MWNSRLQVAGFFAGMGLVKIALEQSGFRVVFANDTSPVKPASTLQTTDPKTSLSAISAIYPVTTARMLTWQRLRFPCTDLSVRRRAGHRHVVAPRPSGRVRIEVSGAMRRRGLAASDGMPRRRHPFPADGVQQSDQGVAPRAAGFPPLPGLGTSPPRRMRTSPRRVW